MSSASETPCRILVALLVYNGEPFVGPCLSSLARLDPGIHTADVLVLDDASPNPGWSDHCREMTTDFGFGYYRTPRNLGIPRNMNLGMLRAVEAGYDAVVLLNSDTIVPANLIPTLVRPLLDDASLSSTTAWSNNSSLYSIPNSQPDYLADNPEFIDWISKQVNEEFDGEAIPVPAGVGFCMMIPTRIIKEVGLMDPVFGRGYSEEVDWCLRSHTMGYTSALAPSCFVYHAGSGITKAEGLVGDGDRTVDAHQAIIDQRYPLYDSQIHALLDSGVIDDTRERASQRIITAAARERGYRLETSRLHQNPDDRDVVRFRIDPDGSAPVITSTFEGFDANFAVGEGGVLSTVQSIVGQPPQEIRIFDHGRAATELVADAGRSGTTPVLHRTPYRERVFDY
jgi:GT2 family glycosyltransferase